MPVFCDVENRTTVKCYVQKMRILNKLTIFHAFLKKFAFGILAKI